MFEIHIKPKKILIIGDSILDTYIEGDVSRISPEAPIPVVKIKNKGNKLGGAANVASNITSLKMSCTLISSIGTDSYGENFKKLLEDKKIDNILFKTKKTTTTKVRIMGNNQQVIRLDFEDFDELNIKTENRILETVVQKLASFDAVIISDYGKGFCTEKVCKKIISESQKRNIPVIIDPKGKSWKKYSGAFLICPNFKETQDICKFSIENRDGDVEKAGFFITKKYGINNILVTRSEKGMSLVNKNEVVHFRTAAKEVFDVCGAGDTVIAALTVMLVSEKSLEESVNYANIAASITVSKSGTYSVTLDELRKELNDSDFLDTSLDFLKEKLVDYRKEGKKIVFTNGCFDIIHKGHINYLAEAKKLGDLLIVGLNSDKSVNQLKGIGRPLNKQKDRAAVLSALSFVDFVVIFNEENPQKIIEAIQPDILVKGGDYKIENIVGREIAKKTVIIPFKKGYSTSSIITKIKDYV